MTYLELKSSIFELLFDIRLLGMRKGKIAIKTNKRNATNLNIKEVSQLARE